ncbi:MAG: response regulator [Acidobacteriota bacterium]
MSNGKILIVDDSENIRDVLQANFEYLGYDVLTARDGATALRLVEEQKPSLVILDVMMPEQNGFQVCRKIKSNPASAGTPVIFLSAKGQREDRYWGKDCGADEYLTKPFSTAELERIIEKLMLRQRQPMTLTGFQAEIDTRRARKEEFSVLTVTFDPKALTVFRQKYGEPRYHEAIEAIRRIVEQVVQNEAGEALVWLRGEAVVHAILPGDAGQTRALRDHIVAQANLALKGFYDELDGERGYVVLRHPGDATEEHVPLLTLESTLSSGEAQAFGTTSPSCPETLH